MATFLSLYNITLDDKGRIKIPSAFKKCLEEMKEDTLILTNIGTCLRAFPYKEWEPLQEKLKEMPTFQKDQLAARRLFFSSSNMVQLDKQGRLLIPNPLRADASLNGDIVLVGVNNCFEIWDKTRWGNFLKASEEKREEILENLFQK